MPENHGADQNGNESLVEILLVEDNPSDIELTLHAFDKNRIANCIHIVHDGAEALDFLFCTGAYARRNPNENPKLILPRPQAAQDRRHRGAAPHSRRSTDPANPGCRPHFVP